MSVIMTMRIQADPKRVEQAMTADAEQTQAILEVARRHGVIAHRFYGTGDDQVMIIDEWPDPQSFQAFFEEAGDRIRGVMEQSGVTSEPEINFWEKLDTGDDLGWGAG